MDSISIYYTLRDGTVHQETADNLDEARRKVFDFMKITPECCSSIVIRRPNSNHNGYTCGVENYVHYQGSIIKSPY